MEGEKPVEVRKAELESVIDSRMEAKRRLQGIIEAVEMES